MKFAKSERHLTLKNLDDDFRRKAEQVEKEYPAIVQGKQDYCIGGWSFDRYQDAIEYGYEKIKGK